MRVTEVIRAWCGLTAACGAVGGARAFADGFVAAAVDDLAHLSQRYLGAAETNGQLGWPGRHEGDLGMTEAQRVRRGSGDAYHHTAHELLTVKAPQDRTGPATGRRPWAVGTAEVALNRSQVGMEDACGRWALSPCGEGILSGRTCRWCL